MKTVITRFPGKLVFAVLPVFISSPASAQDFPPEEDLQTMVRLLVEDGETMGIVLGVLEADGSTKIVSSGSGGPDTEPLGPRSVFEIGSATKTFTGVLLAEMVGRAEVAFEDPVSKYLPDQVQVPSHNGREITLLDLATHTSGLPRDPTDYWSDDPDDPWAEFDIEALYELLSGYALEQDPGTEYAYSNVGMGLLGHALARAAGSSYSDLLRERVLAPLGMDLTQLDLSGEAGQWATTGHRRGRQIPPWILPEAIQGAGGLFSCAEDMLKYLKANVGPPETDLEHAMQTAQEVRGQTGERGVAYGLAWEILDYGDRQIVHHAGATYGFHTQIAFDPQRSVGIVVLTNSASMTDNLGGDLIRFGPPPPIQEVQVNPEVLSRYTGEYRDASGNSLFVRLEDGGFLTSQGEGRVRDPMYAESETAFFLKRIPWRMTFQVNEFGEVGGMVLAANGREIVAQRVGEDIPDPEVVAGNTESSASSGNSLSRLLVAISGWGPMVWVFVGLLGLFAVTGIVNSGRRRRGEKSDLPTSLILTLRWTARILSVLFIVAVSVFVLRGLAYDRQAFGEAMGNVGLRVLFGGFVLLGLVLGWKREAVGGLIAVIAAGLLVVSIGNPIGMVWGVPGVLFLLAGILSRKSGAGEA
jgi:CubicO group peptidase (beta-lactamase class C family)